MSDLSPDRSPADPNAGRRFALRVAGGIVALLGLALVVTGFVDFLRVFGSQSMDAEPTRFWMLMVGLPVLVVGLWLLQAGYLRFLTTYAAQEAAPGLRVTGESLGLHRAADDATGRFCPQCGGRAPAGSRFCASCGTSLG
jgi:hypothetical protein